jgi:hypothetical protein
MYCIVNDNMTSSSLVTVFARSRTFYINSNSNTDTLNEYQLISKYMHLDNKTKNKVAHSKIHSRIRGDNLLAAASHKKYLSYRTRKECKVK